VRAREKITSRRPREATTSAKRWDGETRWVVEIEIATRPNIALATTAPTIQPATWDGR
jgi:hypothetical protein